MKVHPIPKKRNATSSYNANSNPNSKKLRRLPHIFSRVLELPFPADTDVLVHETATCLNFTVSTRDVKPFDHESVRAHTMDIFPGVVKVVVKDDDNYNVDDEMELDKWRFRLSTETRPRLARAELVNEELVVVIPKGVGEEEEEHEEFEVGRLVVVQ